MTYHYNLDPGGSKYLIPCKCNSGIHCSKYMGISKARMKLFLKDRSEEEFNQTQSILKAKISKKQI